MKPSAFFRSLAALNLVLFLASCNEEPPVGTAADYSNGTFVLNEGNFGASNASVTFQSRETGEVTEIPFASINRRPLGDVLQSMMVVRDKGWLAVNNSGKVEVVKLSDFKSVFTITEAGSPRYMLPINSSQYYLSDWSSNTVKLFSFSDATSTLSIPVGIGPEQMVMSGNRVFVANLGGFGVDSTISVINTATHAVEATLEVGSGPIALGVDVQGDIWVLCRGDYKDYLDATDDIGGSLHRIDASTLSVEKDFYLNYWDHPTKLVMNPGGTAFYYLNGTLYQMGIADSTLPSTSLVNRYFYGLSIDPVSGEVIATDPVDYQQRGWAIRYQEDGSPVDSFRTGIIPGDCAFSQ